MNRTKVQHLRAVLDFMYTGEATCLQSDIGDFMQLADALEVATLSKKINVSKFVFKLERNVY